MTELSHSDLLPQAFYRHVDERPNALYLTQPIGNDEVETYSFVRVLDEAQRMAAHLRSLGFPARSKIAIVSKNCAEFFITDLAIWMAGHISVALYPTLTPDTVEYILEHSEAKLLFVGKLDVWDQLKEGVPASLPCIAFSLAPPTDYPSFKDILAKNEPIEDRPTSNPDDEALIIYTSGSTGKPKGVLHNFGSIVGPSRGIVKVLDAVPEDRYLSYLPLAHAMDRWLAECVSMYVGYQIFFAESLTTFVQDLKRARPTLFLSVPRLWLKFQLGVFAKMPEKKLNRLLKIPILSGIVKKKILAQLGLDAVRFAGSGSAPIPGELLTWYRNLGLELLEGYGMSENFNYSHLNMPGKSRAGYVGNTYSDVECKLSESNEILVKSSGMMVGYYKQPELTQEVITEDGFLRTGDQGELDAQGRLRITGRVKDLFKTSKGKYVAPVPIENMLNANSNIELSCVCGASQPSTHAVLQLAESLVEKLDDKKVREDVAVSLEKLLDTVNKDLPDFERLSFVVVAEKPWGIDTGELTPSMKLKRSTIEKLYEPHLEKWYGENKRVIWQS